MRIKVVVAGVPPKKDGSTSVWGKPVEIPRLQALRAAVFAAMPDPIPPKTAISLKLKVFAPARMGDLDNFVTGICDGLMAAHNRFAVKGSSWEGCASDILPDRVIGFVDDANVFRIEAERVAAMPGEVRYELEIVW